MPSLLLAEPNMDDDESLMELFDLLIAGAGKSEVTGVRWLLDDITDSEIVLLPPPKKLVSILTGEVVKKDRDFSRRLDMFSPRKILVWKDTSAVVMLGLETSNCVVSSWITICVSNV